MKGLKLTGYCLISLVLLFSCNQSPKTTKTADSKNTYHNKDIGWTVSIPSGWELIKQDESEAMMQEGREAIAKSGDTEVNESGLKHLIEFKKNSLNLFTSTAQPYHESFPGEYAQNCYEMGKVIYSTLTEQGMRLDSAYGEEEIQGLRFYTFYTTVYDSDGEVLLNQVVYSRLINGYDFSVNLNYNNAADKAVLLKTWKESEFE